MKNEYTEQQLYQIVLTEFPTPIAVNLKRVLETERWNDKAERAVKFFEILIRFLCLPLINQYLVTDQKDISNAYLNRLLLRLSKSPSLGTWVDLLFTTIKTYQSSDSKTLFISELENLLSSSKIRTDIFDEIIRIRNFLAHDTSPFPEEVYKWQEIYETIYQKTILLIEQLLFLRDYDLVFLDGGEGQAQIHRYKGLEVSRQDAVPKSPFAGLEPRHFFIHKTVQPQALLKLHPFFTPYRNGGPDDEYALIGLDAGLLDKIKRNTWVKFWATVTWQTYTLKNDPSMLDFFDQYENAIMEKVEQADRIDLDTFKRFVRHINDRTFKTFRSKYDARLYLDRDKVRATFEDFLDSEKTCLVITGKSGVGKSNFSMATAAVYNKNEDEENPFVLIYNGARLLSHTPFPVVFAADFTQFLSPDLKQKLEHDHGQDVFRLIDASGLLAGRELVIIIDALNENPEARIVLQGLDAWIEQNDYPWLKIVITSRPEAWRVMTRNVNLAVYKYFWQAGQREMGVELEIFREDASSTNDPIQMLRFGSNEVGAAYEKYKKVFQLNTHFDQIPVDVRQELRDPLIMKLVGRTYGRLDGRGSGDIPKKLHVRKIYADYIDSLLLKERLTPRDLNFLEKSIVPTMMARLSNQIDEDDLAGDDTLYDRIINSYLSLDNKPVNIAFTNLVDVEILSPISLEDEIIISFNYERFFDHFCGEYLFRANQDKQPAEKIKTYEALFAELAEKQYLWGVLKHALVLEFESDNIELLDLFVVKENNHIRELVVAVLEETGKDSDKLHLVEAYVRKLLQLENKPLANLLGRFGSRNQEALGLRSSSRTALEVARRLNLVSVLEAALFSNSATIRYSAIRNVYYFWMGNRSEGEDLLDRIESRVLGSSYYKAISMVDPCLGLTALLLRQYYPDKREGRQLGERLINFWRRFLRKLLLETQEDERGRQIVAPYIRNLIVNTLIDYIVRAQQRYTEEKPSFLDELDMLITGSDALKARYRYLLDFLENPGDLYQIGDEIKAAIADNDSLTSVIVWFILLYEYREFEDSDLPFIADLVYFGLEQEPVGIYMQAIVQAIGFLGYQNDEVSDTLYTTHESVAKAYLKRSRGLYYSKNGTKHPNVALAQHVVLRAKRNNPQDEDVFAQILLEAVAEKDWLYVDRILDSLSTVVSGVIDMGMGRLTLMSVRPLFPIQDAEFEDRMVRFLAKTRVYYPEEVDFFVLEVDENNELLPRILRIEPEEDTWSEMIHNTFASILIRMLDTPEIKTALVEMLNVPLTHSDLKTSLKSAARILVNTVAGKDVF